MKSSTLTILIFGDIFGKAGRVTIEKCLPKLKREYTPDLIIANAENLAHGYGVTTKTFFEMKDAGIDIFTSGNHILNKPDGRPLLNTEEAGLIRPYNYPDRYPGKGYIIHTIGNKRIFVLNLVGTVFIKEAAKNPFVEVKKLLKQFEKEAFDAILVDFHAEATSEKVAMGYFLDGKVSVLYGTHTHVPTADERILPNGTGYCTDIGMTGTIDSVIGLEKEGIIKNYLTGGRGNISVPEMGKVQCNALLVEIDTKTRRTKSIKRIHKETTI